MSPFDSCWAIVLLCVLSTVQGQELDTNPNDIQRVKENIKDVVLYTGSFSQTKQNCDLEGLVISDSSIFHLNASAPISDSLNFSLTLIQPLDYEQTRTVTIQFSSSWDCPRGSEVIPVSTRLLFVEDVKDTPPIFSEAVYSVSVPENQALNSSVVENTTAKEVDGQDTFRFIVNFEEYQKVMFRSHIHTSFSYLDIILMTSLDYELQQKHVFTVTANDSVGLTSSSQVVINVVNVQDSPPVFSALLYNGRVNEADPPGTVVLRVSATDGDAVAFQDQGTGFIENQIQYSVIDGAVGMFDINMTTGEIFTTGTLDIDTNPDVVNGLVIMTVKAEEQNSSGLPQYGEIETTVKVQIQIEDANDNRPQFNAESYTGSIRSDALAGELVTIQRGDYISVVDIDVSPTNNHFSIGIEKDGVPWDMFISNIDSQYGQASLLLQLNKDNGLIDMAETHVTFQIVAQEISSSNGTLPPVKVNMVLWVTAQSTPAPPAEPVINLPLTTSDIFVFIVGALLLLNFILTVIICYFLRGGRQPSFFKRNDKYYVSERKKRDAENAANARSAENSGTNISNSRPVTTEVTVNEGKLTSGLGVNAERTTDSVASAANRNRCDVTPLAHKRDDQTDTVDSTQQADSGTTQSQTHTQEGLLNILQGTYKGNTCDVIPLATPGSDNPELKREDPKKSQKNPQQSKISNVQNQNLASQEHGLSHLLQRVQEKLGQGRKQEMNEYQDACDLRPLQTKPKGKHFSDISPDSSFSESSTADVRPLIKSSQMKDKSDQHVFQNSTFQGRDSNKDNATSDGKNKQASKNVIYATGAGTSNIKPESASSVNLKLKDGKQNTSIPASSTQPASYQNLYRPTFQMNQTDVPPIALALPTHAPTGTERMDPYRGIINPVFSSSDERPGSLKKSKATPAPVPAPAGTSGLHKTAFSKPTPKVVVAKQDLSPVEESPLPLKEEKSLTTSGGQDTAPKDVPSSQRAISSNTDSNIKPLQPQGSQSTPNLQDTSKKTPDAQDYVAAAKQLLSTVASSPRQKPKAGDKSVTVDAPKISEEKVPSTPKTETTTVASPGPKVRNGPAGNGEKLTSF